MSRSRVLTISEEIAITEQKISHNVLVRQLARDYSVSTPTISRTLRRQLGHNFRHYHLSKEKRALIILEKKAFPDVTLKSMAYRYKVSQATISRVLQGGYSHDTN